MADPSHAAAALLKLYELRTEPTLRQARAWFVFEFHPTSSQDVLAVWLGPGHESAPYRMVTTYWDMAASLVNNGAIDEKMSTMPTANTSSTTPSSSRSWRNCARSSARRCGRTSNNS